MTKASCFEMELAVIRWDPRNRSASASAFSLSENAKTDPGPLDNGGIAVFLLLRHFVSCQRELSLTLSLERLDQFHLATELKRSNAFDSVSDRNFFQSALCQLKTLVASGNEELKGIVKVIGRWSDPKALWTWGSLMAIICLLIAKSRTENLSLFGGRAVILSGT